MNRLCKYKDILGVPNSGFHSARLFGFARNDFIGTFGIAFIITLIFYRQILLQSKMIYNGSIIINIVKSFIIISIILFIIGILLHRLFCINTTLNKMIFGKM